MIYKIISVYNLHIGDYGIDIDDLYQEASLALYGAVFTFEQERNVKFSSYAFTVIRSRIGNVIRKYKSMYREEYFSLDVDKYTEEIVMVNDVALNYYKENQFKNYLDRFINKLNQEDKEIMRLYHEDYSYKEMARLLNTSTKRIDNRLASLRKRLRTYVDRYSK